MAVYRETPCKFYIAHFQCQKGRKAEDTGYCQRCGKYVPRAKVRHINKKKEYLLKAKQNDMN